MRLPLTPNPSPSGGEWNQKLPGFVEHVFREIDAGAIKTALAERDQAAAGATTEVDHLARCWQVFLDKEFISFGERGVTNLGQVLLGKLRIVQIFPQAGGDPGG